MCRQVWVWESFRQTPKYQSQIHEVSERFPRSHHWNMRSSSKNDPIENTAHGATLWRLFLLRIFAWLTFRIAWSCTSFLHTSSRNSGYVRTANTLTLQDIRLCYTSSVCGLNHLYFLNRIFLSYWILSHSPPTHRSLTDLWSFCTPLKMAAKIFGET
jgi:hypothetical protein